MYQPGSDLHAAVERAFEVFAAYTRPHRLCASPLRDPDEILRRLSAAPLRELTGEDIGPYCGWALTTVGNDRDYRHFLPRILELAVTEPFWMGTEPPVLAGKLQMSDWRNWPVAERAAVTGFFHAAFDAAVMQHPDTGHHASRWLCGLVASGEEPDLALRRWLAATAENAALQLASFIDDQAKNWRRSGAVSGSWWDDLPMEPRRRIAQRLMSDDVRRILEAASPALSDGDRFYLVDSALIELQRVV